MEANELADELLKWTASIVIAMDIIVALVFGVATGLAVSDSEYTYAWPFSILCAFCLLNSCN